MEHAAQTSCILCSLGCPFIIENRFGEAVGLEYARKDTVFGGKLCSKGNYALELINHPFRLIEPKADGKPVAWPAALEIAAREFSAAKSAGVIISGDVSVEDAVLASEFTRTCLAGGRLAAYFPTGDDEVCRSLIDTGVTGRVPAIEEIARSTCSIAVGDPFEIGPVIAGPVLGAKHARRGNTLAVISNGRTRTSRFATIHFSGPERQTLAGLLRCLVDESGNDGPGWMRVVREHISVPGDAAVANLAKTFMKAPSAVLILETQDPVTAALAGLAVRAAGDDRKLLPVFSYANTLGVSLALKEKEPVETLLAAAGRGEVDTLLVLGADIVRGGFGESMRKARASLRFLAVGAPFENDTTRMADLVFPTALWLEAEGTYNGKHLLSLVEAPGEAPSSGELMRRLAFTSGNILLAVPSEPAPGKGEPSAETVNMILTQIGKESPAPPVRSSTVRYGDGSLTDRMGWLNLVEVNGW